MQPCSELRHIYQQHGEQWESVIFSGPISNATIYQRQFTTTLDPRPVAQVGAERGWCQLASNNLDAPLTSTAQVPMSRPPLPKTSEVIDVAIALLVFAAAAAGIRVLSLHFAPPPLPPSGAEPQSETVPDRFIGPFGDGPASVSMDHAETTEKPSDHGEESAIEEAFDLTGITLREFKDDLCDGVANGGKGFEPYDLSDPKREPAIAAAVQKYLDEYGPQKKDFCLWQVFGLTRKSGSSPYAARCDRGLQFIEQKFSSYQPTELF